MIIDPRSARLSRPRPPERREHEPSLRPRSSEHGEDSSDRMDFGLSRFERAADEAGRSRVPFHRDEDEWHYQRELRIAAQRRAAQFAPPPPPEPKPPLVSDTVLRVLVGDLAPQVSGALNLLNESASARTAATLAGIAGMALAMPKFLK